MAGIQGMGAPSDIKNPVPQVDLGAQLTPQLAPQQANAQPPVPMAPQEQAPAQEAGTPSLSDLAMQHTERPSLSELAAENVALSPEEEANQADKTDADTDNTNSIPGLLNQLKDTSTRFKASFTTSDSEKKTFLERTYGADGVKKVKGGFLVKREGKWRKFDSENFELINDVADFGRDAVVGTTTALGEAAGAGIAAAETLGTGGMGALAAPALIGGGIATGAMIGNRLANQIQENVLGIPIDKERNLGKEDLWATAGGMIGSAASKVLSAGAARLFGKGAEEALLPIEQKVASEVQTAAEGVQAIKEATGEAIKLLPNQAAPSDLTAQATAEKLAGQPKVQSAYLQVGDQIKSAFQKIADGFANFSGTKKGVGNAFLETSQAVQAAEGKLIGDFRERAIKAAGDGEIPVVKLQEKLNEVTSQLGFRVERDKLIAPTEAALYAKGFTEAGAKRLNVNVQAIAKEIFNSEGRVPMARLDGLYKQWNAIYDNLPKTLEMAKSNGVILNIKNAIRDDFTNSIGTILEGDTKQVYQAALKKFSSLKGAADTLGGMLDKEAISSTALAKSLFNKSAGSLEKIQAVRALLADKPHVWQDVSGQFIRDTIDTATTKGVTNWSKVASTFKGLGDDIVSEIVPGNRRAFDAILSTAERVFDNTPTFRPKEGITKKFLYELSGLSPGKAFLVLIDGFDRSRKMAKFLASEGVDRAVQGLPPKQAGRLKVMLQTYADFVGEKEMLKLGAATGAATGTEAAQRK